MLGFFDLGALGGLDEFGTGSDTGGAPPPGTTTTGGGLDYYMPGAGHRKKRVRDAEERLQDAHERGSVRDVKHAAAVALSVGQNERDQLLAETARDIIALKKLELSATAYLDRVGEILARREAQDADDLEAFMVMARLS